MDTYLIPFFFAVFIWWFSTGLVFMTDGRAPKVRGWILIAVTILLFASLIGIWLTRDMTTVAGAYMAFGCGLGIWAWNEVMFLLGYVTGPVQHALPKGTGAGKKFLLAAGTVLYHEMAILISGLVIILLSENAGNRVAWWTFGVLWVMRLSAKLNVYFGVANLAVDLLPPHLTYLKSYFGTRRISAFFALSVTAGTVLAALIYHGAHGSAFQITAAMLVGTMMALALLEHWLLVLPIQDAALWKWAISPKSETRPVEPAPDTVKRNATVAGTP